MARIASKCSCLYTRALHIHAAHLNTDMHAHACCKFGHSHAHSCTMHICLLTCKASACSTVSHTASIPKLAISAEQATRMYYVYVFCDSPVLSALVSCFQGSACLLVQCAHQHWHQMKCMRTCHHPRHRSLMLAGLQLVPCRQSLNIHQIVASQLGS